MTWSGTLAAWLRDGPRLVREGATLVELTDREPAPDDDGPAPTGRWFWLPVGANESCDDYCECYLPADLFALLLGGELDTDEGQPTHYYDTREAATDALSEALVRCATGRVDVPAWVAEIEGRIATHYDGTGDPGDYSNFGELAAASADAARLCREVRELLAIIHDLREDRGEVYVVVEDLGYGGERIQGVFLSRAEAERRAGGWANHRVVAYACGRPVVPRFDLSGRARKTMQRLGVTTAQELARCTESYVLEQRNTGQATLRELGQWLAAHGLQFAGRG